MVSAKKLEYMRLPHLRLPGTLITAISAIIIIIIIKEENKQ